jgi:hypothetical protein
MKMRKPQIGDIVEIQTNKGLAYALYTHRNEKYGALLRVFGRIFASRPASFNWLSEGPPQFDTFFPLRAALQKGIVKTAENIEVPAHLRGFPVFRNGTPHPSTKNVEDWWLWDGDSEWRVGKLTSEQRRLPLLGVINDTLLCRRIESGWTAETDPR